MDFDKFRAQVESFEGTPSIAKNVRVLLVDHDTTSLMLLATQLEQKQYKVTTTESASVALSLFRKRKGFYNIVVADYHMPEMPAFVFTHKILRKCLTMPVLLMAKEVEVDIATDALCRGVCFFLTKPLRDRDITDLWQHVVRVTGKIPDPQNDSYYVDILTNGNLTNGGSSSGAQNEKRGNLKRSSPVKVNRRNGKNHVSEDLNDLSESNEEKENNKRPRLCWTPSLHAKFMKAIETLGDNKAYPKALLKEMNVSGLTHRQVASHLQKYRDRQRNQASPKAVEDQELPPIKLPTPALNKVSHGQCLAPRHNYQSAPKTPSWLNGSSAVCYSLESVKQKLDALNYSANNTLINDGGVQVQVSQGNGARGQLAQGNGVGAQLTQGINQNYEKSNSYGEQIPWFYQNFSHIAMTGDKVIVNPNPNQEHAQVFSLNWSQVNREQAQVFSPNLSQVNQEQAQVFSPNLSQVTMTAANVIPSANLNRQQATGFSQNFGQVTMAAGDNVIPYSNPNAEQAVGFIQNFCQVTMSGDNVIPYPNPNGEQAAVFSQNSGQATMATTYMLPSGNQVISCSNIVNQGAASDFGMGLPAFGNAGALGNFGEWTSGANQQGDNTLEGMASDYDIGDFNQIIQDIDAGADLWDPFN